MTDTSDDSAADVAVIGMACRFPGAATPSAFWELLREGREARTELDAAELAAAGVPATLIAHPDYVKAGMFLDGMEQFDAGFFGFSPLDARIMDPQHRHFLECTWEALENAGCDTTRSDAAVGVFAGSGHNAYLPYNLLSNPGLVAEVGFFLLRHTGNDKDFLATRASYCFNLSGPSVNVQTACSTSLVAVHMAVQSLLNGECELAVAGGVTIELPHRRGYLYKESEILSRDGHCRPFDASAGGTVFGSGAGVLVLKRLDDALADGDHIHAVIKASAVNNDGAGKVSYLAPSVDGQAAAIQEALAIGGIEPASVSYVECHGTGTQLGDPIEVAALAQAYGRDGAEGGPRRIGSVKSNIGHLDTAAGVASLIKVILALQHRQLPATLHYQAPNPAIDFSGTGFAVNDRLGDWNGPLPLRAGVSSLGVGGTNAHVIVEEAPTRPAAAPGRAQQLLLLSARTQTALRGAQERLAAWLQGEGRGVELADVAYTLATGRRRFRHRGALVANSHDAAAMALGGPACSRLEAPDNERRVVFMFAGGGAQYPNMGRGLYQEEPAYRAAVDECLALAAAAVDFDLKALLYPAAGAEAAAAAELERPSRALPALFVTQYAQARLWQSWGIEPAALIGHSMGENTAACLAGVLSLRDAIGLVALRGRLFETLPAGGMLSVQLGADAVLPLLGDGLGVAAANAPELCVVSGPVAALAAFEQRLAAADIGFQRIHIDVAAHSAMLDPILPAFEEFLRGLRLQVPQVPFISNVSGDWIAPEQATDPRYWVRHLRQTVRFADGVGRLLESGQYALLEVGPGRTLASLAGLHDAKRDDQPIATSLRHPDDDQPDLPYMLAALGRLWQGGVEPDWNRFFGEGRRRVPLPTYAFDHARHWIEPGAAQTAAGGRRALDDWFLQPAWLPQPLPAPVSSTVGGTACLIGAAAVLARLRPAMASQFTVVLEAVAAECFAPAGADRCQFGDGEADYRQLVSWLAARGDTPLRLYLVADDAADDAMAQLLPLFHLARALADTDLTVAGLTVVTTGALRLPGADAPGRPAATALGAALRVVARELQLPAALVDLPAGWGEREARWLAAEPVVAEPASIAYRGGQRLRQTLQASPLPAAEWAPRDGGVYLITGGLGGLGLTLARHLARRPVRLVLLGRQLPPSGEAAEFHLVAGGETARRIEALRELERAGAEVLLLRADVADRAALAAAIAEVDRRFGRIDGVFHTAGVLADALLPMKSTEDLQRVLAPKVAGVLNLQALLAGRPLDCFVLYSSTSAWAGLPGQFDYAAANAFLDGFAQAAAGAGLPALAVNWPVWREVGMAAALVDPPPARPAVAATVRSLVDGDAHRFLLDGDDWLIAEHCTRTGAALVPGTGFVELAYRAAAQRLGGAVSLRELFLLQPLLVAPGQRVVVSVVFDGEHFSIYSSRDADAAARGEWLAHHAQGGAVCCAVAPAATLPLAELEGRCGQLERPSGGRVDHPHMDFGPHWHAVQSIGYGSGEAVIRLTLPAAFAGDLAAHPLHPALLDMATGAAQRLLPDDGGEAFFVPQSYGEIRVRGPLAGELVSHVVRIPGADPDSCVLNITIADTQGAELVSVVGFALRRLAGGVFAPTAAAPADAALHALFEEGIDPAEGMQVIDRLLASPGLSQVLVLPHGAEQLTLREPVPVDADATMDNMAAGDRPALSTDYVAPTTELERTLAGLWLKALGIGRVGVQDDFFELGGHSLLLIQLVNRAKKQVGVSLPLAKLFGRPTIAGWVELLAQEQEQAASSAQPTTAKPVLKRVQRDAYRTSGGD